MLFIVLSGKEQQIVRFAKEEDLTRVNELRRMVNDLHCEGKSDIFRDGWCKELEDHVFAMWSDEDKDIIVAERDGGICGYACVNHIHRPQSPYMWARDLYEVNEFGVDEKFRRQGVATELFEFLRADATTKGFPKIDLNVWEFNQEAIQFYEAVGFQVYRRYMEFKL